MCNYRVVTVPLLPLLTAGLVLTPSLSGLRGLTGLPAGPTPVHAQSLGDVAKKEQERRKQQGEKGKVYTNKDLASVPPASVQPPPEQAPSSNGSEAASQPPRSDDKGASGSKTDGSKTDGGRTDGGKADNSDKGSGEKDKTKDPAYWGERKKALQATLDRDSTFADAMQSKINALNTEFVNRDDPAQRAAIERNRLKALADLEGLKKQIVADKKALADFEEEARRAGVPPGWLR